MFDGLLAHMHFTDGYTYQASTFGETDSTSGIWKPKTAPSVTYGTNGFFLKFENSGAMGTDSSGNSKHIYSWSRNTNSKYRYSNKCFCTLNSIYKRAYQSSFTNGNLTATTAGATEITILVFQHLVLNLENGMLSLNLVQVIFI